MLVVYTSTLCSFTAVFEQADYMAAVGEDDPFLKCELFDNDEFRTFRENARERRSAFGAEASHSEQLRATVPVVAAVIDNVADKLAQLSSDINDGRRCTDGQLSQMNRAINAMACGMDRNIDRRQLELLDTMKRCVGSVMQELTTPSNLHMGETAPAAQEPQALLERPTAVPSLLLATSHSSTRAVAVESSHTSRNSTVLGDGDPGIYTFFELPKGNEVQLCYDEFETGVFGNPSLNSIEAQHGAKWRSWTLGGKHINRKAKTFLFRKRVYEKAKLVAATENITIVESIAWLRQQMDEFVAANKKRGLDAFSETLKNK
jgi:hypothetical protein